MDTHPHILTNKVLELVSKLVVHSSIKNFLKRYVFRHTNQERFESVEKFYMRLMQLAATYNFTETSSEIKSQLIAGSINDKITRKGLSEPDLSLDKLLQFAKTQELTDSQNKAVRRTSQTTTVNHVNDSRQRGKQPPNRPKQKRIPHYERSYFNCGGNWPHEGGQTQCPARGSRCSICHKTNHFVTCCKNKTMIGLVGIQYTHPLIDRLNAAINTSSTCRPTKTSSTYTH